MGSAISDTIGDTLVTREYLDLRLAELRADIARDLAATKGSSELSKRLMDRDDKRTHLIPGQLLMSDVRSTMPAAC